MELGTYISCIFYIHREFNVCGRAELGVLTLSATVDFDWKKKNDNITFTSVDYIHFVRQNRPTRVTCSKRMRFERTNVFVVGVNTVIRNNDNCQSIKPMTLRRRSGDFTRVPGYCPTSSSGVPYVRSSGADVTPFRFQFIGIV